MNPSHLHFSLSFNCCTLVKNSIPSTEKHPLTKTAGLMFWEAKKKKSTEPSTIELFAVLTLSILVLMIHLFLSGTYAALIVRVLIFSI